MKLLLWAGVGLLLLLWTALAGLVAALAGWAQQGLAAGSVAQRGAELAEASLPAWATWWVNPGWLMGLIDGFAQALAVAQATMPWLGAAAGWMAGLTWFLWGLGCVLLVLLAVLAHWGVGRLARSTAGAAAPA